MLKRRFFMDSFFIIAISLIIAFAFVSANNHTTDTNTSFPLVNTNPTSSEQTTALNSAYSCLRGAVSNRSVSSLSLQEAIFAALALESIPAVIDTKIESEKGTGDCWPKASCNVKETAQVFLYQQRTGKNSANTERWLLSRNATSTDLNWYLEIDIARKVPAECTLTYDGTGKKVNILEDMRMSGNPGNCFSFSQNGYWLLFKENCYGKEVQISCNQDFITATVYEKKGGDITYVLPDTHSAAALGSTTEKVNVKCFKTGNSCDYEGSLWATLALQKKGVNVDSFVPYLIAMTENNKKYFPSAFLYSLTGADDQYSDIVQSQKQGRSWKMIGTPYNEFYDTALGMLGLSKSNSLELENTKNYLLSIQGKDGCWNNGNIRDTAFLLYGGWPRSTSSSGGGGDTLCTSVLGQSCESSGRCIEAGGRVLSNFQCSFGFDVCCSIKVEEQSCTIQNGNVCSAQQDCSGNSIPSSDSGVCCIGSCVEKQVENTCESSGGICKGLCGDDEEETSVYACSFSGEICCVEKVKESSGAWKWIIIILVILIILAILAIVFRDKLKVWWFKFKGRAKVSPVVKPGVSPAGFSPRPAPYGNPMMRQRPYVRPPEPARAPPRMPPRRVNTEKDKELDETLKKLRDMSK